MARVDDTEAFPSFDDSLVPPQLYGEMRADQATFRKEIEASGFTHVAEPVLPQIAEQIFDHCLADDIKATQGLGGDNMTAVIVKFKR